MVNNFIICPYQRRDRQAVRKICCDTADRGEPVENFFADREVFADLLTSYYTDFEAGALSVAKQGAEVIGYLTGCLDTRRYVKIMTWQIVPKALLKSVSRGLFLRRQTWQLIRAMLTSWQMGGFRRHIPLDIYPAHLHANVKQGFRGQGVGQQLVEQFFVQAKSRNAKGIHLSVREDNFLARKFFEDLGFLKLAPSYPMVMPNGNVFEVGYTLVYGKIL